MGIYINPGNEAFRGKRNGKYVDKSGLIGVVNRSIGLPHKLSCVSRPRRFGKSYAAQMLCAYYSLDCDSAPLFDDLIIAQDETYRELKRVQRSVQLMKDTADEKADAVAAEIQRVHTEEYGLRRYNNEVCYRTLLSPVE